MKKVLFIALLLCGIGWGAKAQTVAVKSNILYDATATVNLGAEVAFNRHWSLDISGNYNGWDVASDKSWQHWMVQPEARYWLHEKFNGHYFGVHGVYMDYDMSHVNFMSVMKKDFAYDGNAYGGGISYGYQLYLSPHWNIEFSAGESASCILSMTSRLTLRIRNRLINTVITISDRLNSVSVLYI